MYKAGIPPMHNNFHHIQQQRAHALASENMDLQVVGCMDQTRLRNEINYFLFF